MSAQGTKLPNVNKAWNGVGNILLGGITGNVPALVAELTLLGEGLAGKELDDFNTACTLFSEDLQATGDWNGSFQKAFGSGSAFQAAAKSDFLSAAIQGVADLVGFVQGWVGVLKSIL